MHHSSLASGLPLYLYTDGPTEAMDAEEVQFRDSLGMAYLAALIAQPAQPMHVLDLAARRSDAGAADSGEVLDQRARTQVRARMHDLATELEDTEASHDLGR